MIENNDAMERAAVELSTRLNEFSFKTFRDPSQRIEFMFYTVLNLLIPLTALKYGIDIAPSDFNDFHTVEAHLMNEIKNAFTLLPTLNKNKMN